MHGSLDGLSFLERECLNARMFTENVGVTVYPREKEVLTQYFQDIYTETICLTCAKTVQLE